ncbi:probable splicing factor, arginine/serine-rich 7 [Bombus flavifrons]|uniref:probable splicing factor, arginine/serine-rich 7 n=1 Tax=Bombus flavifrons TaxID=103934 RepID=UPI003704A448
MRAGAPGLRVLKAVLPNWDVWLDGGGPLLTYRVTQVLTGHGCFGIRKMKRYIQKAIDFGVESGYLIPKDAAYKVLRVSSDLMNEGNYESKDRKSDSTVSQVEDRRPRRTPIRFEDYEVQDARGRRRRSRRRSSRRRRSRSGSRRRRRRSRRRSRRRHGRRRDESGAEEEVVEIENDDDYDFEKQGEKRKSPDNANVSEKNERLNQSDGEKKAEKAEDDGSDLSIDEDESDDEEGKKREDTTKS